MSFFLCQDAPPSTPSAPTRVPPRTGKRPPLISSPPGQVKNYVHAKQLPVASRPSVFQSPDEDEEEDYEQWLEIKGRVQELPPYFDHCPPAPWVGPVVSGEGVASGGEAPAPQAKPRASMGLSRLGGREERVWGAVKGKCGGAIDCGLCSGSRGNHPPPMWAGLQPGLWPSQRSIQLCLSLSQHERRSFPACPVWVCAS